MGQPPTGPAFPRVLKKYSNRDLALRTGLSGKNDSTSAEEENPRPRKNRGETIVAHSHHFAGQRSMFSSFFLGFNAFTQLRIRKIEEALQKLDRTSGFRG